MFKSHRKSHPSTVSPLAPPPASTFVHPSQSNSPLSGHPGQGGQGQSQGMTSLVHPQHPQQGMPPPNGMRYSPSGLGGLPSPNDLQRIGTAGTVGSVSSKGEKRRSGFFGLGGKKDKKEEKDKVKDKERGKGQNEEAPRSSFSVDRPHTQEYHTMPNRQYQQQQQQFQPPQSTHTPPLQSHSSSSSQQSFPPNQGGPGHQRIVSQPQLLPNSNDFGPYPSPTNNFPKSQSMGFGPRQGQPQAQGQGVPGQGGGGGQGGIPETHPYRGYLGGQDKGQPEQIDQRQRQNQGQGQAANAGVPRSQSMPLNPNNRSNASPPPPPIERETMGGSPKIQDPKKGGGGAPQQGTGLPGQNGQAQGQGNPAWMKQFDAIVDLIALQPQKTYVASPPELEMILARTSAGGQPKQGQPGSASNDWDSVWLQLSGISLSMWSMKETRAAAAKGEKVPPTYFNITDSSLELLAPLPPPPHRPNSHPHHFVFSLNTAGSNRLLFSCPSERDLARWATGLRLAAWERARLEEIYTGHLIKSGGQEPKSQLVRGRLEGWVRVRVMGGTDWKRLWVVLSTPNALEDKDDEKKNRRRSFFGLGDKEKEVVQEPNTGVSMASFYLEPRTPKNKTSVAVLTITNVTQAYAVFPERLEVMSQSNLMKVVGRIGGELVTIEGRLRDSGWALIMPETPESSGSNTPPAPSPLSNMMKWVTGFHDVFAMYGRPERYDWDPKSPKSLFFAYPQGTERTRLFLDIDEAIQSDFRTSNLPAVRSQFSEVVRKRLAGPAEQYRRDEEEHPTPRPEGDYRLPPLQFGDDASPQLSHEGSAPRSLTPITERTDITDMASRTNSQRTAKSNFLISERRHSDAPPSKQGSGGSSRNVTGSSLAADDRLAPIPDSTEPFSSYTTDEPEKATPTTVDHSSHTTPTTWSRSSGHSPVQPEGAARPHPDAFPVPTPLDNNSARTTIANGHKDELPDLPSANSGAPSTAQPQQQQPAPLAAAVVASPQDYRSAGGNDHPVIAPSPRRGSVDAANKELHDEPAAMYLMNMVEEPQSTHNQNRNQNAPAAAAAPAVQQKQDQSHLAAPASVTSATSRTTPSPERARPTIITSFENGRPSSSNETLGRKPSGARAPPPKKSSTASTSRNLEVIGDESALIADAQPPQNEGQGQLQAQKQNIPPSTTQSDFGEDATHFLAYADQPSPTGKKPLPPIQAVSSPPPQAQREEEIRSSFAPSRAAEERRAKAEAQAAEQTRAMNVPGGGKRIGPSSGAGAKDTWSGSEDEDEVDEDPEHSPVAATAATERGRQQYASQEEQTPQQQSVQRVVSQTRALPPVPRPNGDEYQPSRQEYSTFSGAGAPERSRSRSPAYAQPHQPQQQQRRESRSLPQQPQQPQAQAPAPPAQRQTVWNANFSAEHGMEQPKSGKFVELDEPAHLTKAFAPHGLLQAGIQDKEDRSAKKQEETARELGSSLVNVPSKPPPPQTGLLGAVAAHERDRKNAGGIGATLTDREREKRLAEDRQREIEKLQRQQMEHMSKFGGGEQQQGLGSSMGMYGQQPSPYVYGMPPHMMGMPMGYNPYQGGYSQQAGGYNPYAQQHAMMAAQMAYHQAMMNMSQSQSGAGGSQSGHQNLQQPAGSPDARPESPTGSGINMPGMGIGQSPSPGPYGGGYFPNMGGMYPPWPPMAPWGSPSPPPPGMPGMGGMSGMGGMPGYPGMPGMQGGSGMSSPWLRPQGGGNSQDEGNRSRVQSMYSEGGHSGGHAN